MVARSSARFAAASRAATERALSAAVSTAGAAAAAGLVSGVGRIVPIASTGVPPEGAASSCASPGTKAGPSGKGPKKYLKAPSTPGSPARSPPRLPCRVRRYERVGLEVQVAKEEDDGGNCHLYAAQHADRDEPQYMLRPKRHFRAEERDGSAEPRPPPRACAVVLSWPTCADVTVVPVGRVVGRHRLQQRVVGVWNAQSLHARRYTH